MMVHMRSNDVYLGLPHDIFAFTMLQEIAAREIGVGLGSYLHSVGSMHLYADPDASIPGSGKLDHRADAQAYIDEGLFSKERCHQCLRGSPWPYIAGPRDESAIRKGNIDFELDPVTPKYWQDIVSLLRVRRYPTHEGRTSPKHGRPASKGTLMGFISKILHYISETSSKLWESKPRRRVRRCADRQQTLELPSQLTRRIMDRYLDWQRKARRTH